MKLRWEYSTGEVVFDRAPRPGDGAGVLLSFLGDVALAREVGDHIEEAGAERLFEKSRDFLSHGGFVILNLECCLGEGGAPWEPKPILMRGKANYLDVFDGIEARLIANVANNHMLDHGAQNARETLDILDQRKIEWFGAIEGGVNKSSVVETDEGRVGLIAFSPAAHALPDEIEPNVPVGSGDDVESQVKALSGDVDLCIVNLHHGVEYCPFVIRKARLLARRAVDAGADCVVSHHAHVVQGIEIYKGVPIFHGIGNFLIKVDFDKHPSARYSLVPHVRIEGGKISGITVQPFRISEELDVTPLTEAQMGQVGKLLSFRSSFLESPVKIMVNDLAALSYRVADRSLAMVDMARREGVGSALRYYGKRIVSR